MTTPLVTVYIPTYNRLDLLKRAINSVLTQTYPNIELIVVDDNSNDGTKPFMQQLSKNNHRVVFHENEVNQGACASRNKAIAIAKGQLITGLDDDDYFLPERISSFVDAWHTKPDKCICLFSNRLVLNKNGHAKIKAPKYINKEMTFLRSYIGNQAFAETVVVKKIHGFDTNLPAWQDFDFCLSLLSLGNAYRVDNESYIVDTSHESERISDSHFSKILQAYNYICQKHKLNKKQQQRLQLQLLNYKYEHKNALRLLWQFIYHGDPQGAWACFKKLIRLGLAK